MHVIVYVYSSYCNSSVLRAVLELQLCSPTCNGCNMGIGGFAKYVCLRPKDHRPRDKGIHVRQITNVHVIRVML